jgi:hypothetical protein
MITQEVNQVRFGQFASEVLTDTADKVLQEQSQIASIYLKKTGWLAEKLMSGIYSVVYNDDGARLIINYPNYVRFLDLKKAASGKAKKYYYPIYNRVLYGRVYGYAFGRLRGFLSMSEEELQQALRMAYSRRGSSVSSNLPEQFTPGQKSNLEVSI